MRRRSFGGLWWTAAMTIGRVAAPAGAHARSPRSPAEPASDAAPTEEVAKAVWKSPYYEGKQVWGYVNRHSVAPGQGFDVMLSTGPGVSTLPVRIEVLRTGPSPGGERELVWSSEAVPVGREEVSSTAAAIGPGWPPTFRGIPTKGWRSGYYTIDAVHADSGTREPNVAYIVVTNPARSGDILVKLGTNTYQAYNDWGGHSLYGSDFYNIKGQIVAFDRPTPPDFLQYDHYLVTWLEKIAQKNNWKVDYATNFDVHIKSNIMEDYQVIIVPGHDEYWTKEEFDAFERRIFAQGKNVLFLGGDIAYAQVRYADVNSAPGGPDLGRQLVAYKRLDDPIRWRAPESEADLLVTARFRDGERRPETMLAGLGSELRRFTPISDRDPAYPLHVARTDLPFFAGVGLEPGDSVGNLAGYEWGNRDPNGDGRRLWDAARSRIAALDPGRLMVLFTGRPRDDDGREGRLESVYFVSPAGAKVFSAGTLRWAWGLGKPGFESTVFRALNENLIRYFLEPAL